MSIVIDGEVVPEELIDHEAARLTVLPGSQAISRTELEARALIEQTLQELEPRRGPRSSAFPLHKLS